MQNINKQNGNNLGLVPTSLSVLDQLTTITTAIQTSCDHRPLAPYHSISVYRLKKPLMILIVCPKFPVHVPQARHLHQLIMYRYLFKCLVLCCYTLSQMSYKTYVKLSQAPVIRENKLTTT